MRAYHNTRDKIYRDPFGAAEVGGAITLSIDIFDDENANCTLRLWINGKGERLIPMMASGIEGGLRFLAEFTPDEPNLMWYSFVITAGDGSVLRYGAQKGRSGGVGELRSWEDPSFQLTVYKKRLAPDWYKNAIVYQIFPDRFNRGADWLGLCEKALSGERNGPKKALCEDWYEPPFYKKDDIGRVIQWDFYGGTLSGIEEKLDYLADLGITALYLNPIFKAASNHRYDTADYMEIDPMLGDEEAFRSLCREAEKRGISVILDGVFNHTGCDSIYFNKLGNYDTVGAYQSEESPYREWFRFDDSPEGYDCWWGVGDLPNVNENNEGFRKFVFEDEDSVVKHWLRAGAKGWRLDVADELPDDFIEGIKTAVTDVLPEDGMLMGEVWEDASNKISYGELRRYFLGTELDSTMNYPFRTSINRFMLGRISAYDLYEALETIHENYPSENFYAALNLVGSHDRPRIMTIMGGAPEGDTMSERERGEYRLSEEQRALAKRRIRLLALVQMTMPGVPCIYYGDEAGVEGYSDPYNRSTFPWGREDRDLETIYRNAISLRKKYPVFVDGSFEPFYYNDDVFGYFRKSDTECMAVLINRDIWSSRDARILAESENVTDILSSLEVTVRDGRAFLTLPPLGSAVLRFE